MTITYQVKNSIYVNLTNRCPCACTFCLRNNAQGVYGSDSLWLEREPTDEEVVKSLGEWDYSRFREVVFCGYGEPTERLDTLLAAAEWLKRRDPSLRVRVNTNGLSELLKFAKEAAACVPEVVMTVVGEPVTDVAKQARCRAVAESLGARLRVRPFES